MTAKTALRTNTVQLFLTKSWTAFYRSTASLRNIFSTKPIFIIKMVKDYPSVQ